MIAGKWLARITEGDHRFPGKQIRQRDVCRIIIVAVRQDEIGRPIKLCICKDVFNEYTLPNGIQFGPRGDAVNILCHLGLW